MLQFIIMTSSCILEMSHLLSFTLLNFSKTRTFEEFILAIIVEFRRNKKVLFYNIFLEYQYLSRSIFNTFVSQ